MHVASQAVLHWRADQRPTRSRRRMPGKAQAAQQGAAPQIDRDIAMLSRRLRRVEPGSAEAEAGPCRPVEMECTTRPSEQAGRGGGGGSGASQAARPQVLYGCR